MKKKQHISVLLFLTLVLIPGVHAQFAPAAGQEGTTAIHKDSPLFVGWANTCSVVRGYINKKDTTITYTQNGVTSNRAFFGTEAMALGKAGGALDCISLGDSGIATLTFDFPIRNGEGADFAVFENGMKMPEPPYQYFLELAFVEVSTDGKRFVRFSATSNTQTNNQVASFGQIDPTQINNFAGKYEADYGTPFDLQDVADSVGINTDSINYIRLVDVCGSIDPLLASYDFRGNIVNDPFPTDFWSSGFDLDAIGVIHMNGITGIEVAVGDGDKFKVYPNPVVSGGVINVEGINSNQEIEVELWSQSGRKLQFWQKDTGNIQMDISGVPTGLYMVIIRGGRNTQAIKVMIE